jgi:hypothetical protein
MKLEISQKLFRLSRGKWKIDKLLFTFLQKSGWREAEYRGVARFPSRRDKLFYFIISSLVLLIPSWRARERERATEKQFTIAFPRCSLSLLFSFPPRELFTDLVELFAVVLSTARQCDFILRLSPNLNSQIDSRHRNSLFF